MKLTGPEVAAIMNKLRVGFDGRRLRGSAVRTWPLDQAGEAYASVAKGSGPIKQVLLPGEG